MYSPTELADLAELNQLAYRYAAAVDACDPEAFVRVFCPEGRISIFGPGADAPYAVTAGHAQLAQVAPMMRQRYRRTAHLMTNHLLDLDGDRASGSLLCTARHLRGDFDHTVVIRYVDCYERRAGDWLILDREIRFLWTVSQVALSDAESVNVVASE